MKKVQISKLLMTCLIEFMEFTKNEKRFRDLLDAAILNNLFDLPSTWRWVRLHDLIDEAIYGTSAITDL